MASSDAPLFKRHQKVVAAVDLPGVPAGTRGKVMLDTGLTWVRYRVRFDNGVEVPWVEADQLATREHWEARTASAGA
jgi:hypothetical protein